MKKLFCKIFGHKFYFLSEKKTKRKEIFTYQCKRCGVKDSVCFTGEKLP